MGGDVNLVFEGIGRVGKSTIIDRIKSNYRYKKLGPFPTISRLFFEFTVYFDCLKNSGGWIIDRGHISEMAYGPWYFPERYKDGVAYDWLLRNDSIMANSNYETVIIYIEPHNFDIMLPDKRCQNREIDLALFRGAITQTKLRVIPLKTQTADGWIPVDDVIANLMEQI